MNEQSHEDKKTVCKKNKCVGCYACHDICPKQAITINDTLDAYNAEINISLCVNCHMCYDICQVNRPVPKINPIEWHQGWSNSKEIRQRSSSGGIAAELARLVIQQDGVVCSCAFADGQFGFQVVSKTDELKKFAGSKYVKSNMSGVHNEVSRMLEKDKKVLFIGLPCQCASLKKTTKKIKKGTLYLVDLICHGTPSPKLLDVFLSQYKISLNKVVDIQFRDKGRFTLKSDRKNIVTPGTMDCYSIAFLEGLTYTENCYECCYADGKRVSDITLGDSWGSDLSSEEGISLVLCNTESGRSLLDEADIYLTDVDKNNAVNSNPQLKAPMRKHMKREKFFAGITNGKKFNALIKKCCWKKCFRQFVKGWLIKLHLIKLVGGIQY